MPLYRSRLWMTLVKPLRAAVPRVWLGMVLPKRHARRSVTRHLLKRQIRAAIGRSEESLSAGLWVVRLRSPFDRATFTSAASSALGEQAGERADEAAPAGRLKSAIVSEHTVATWVTLPQRALILLVRGYRLLLSPWLGSSCRFEPTCSAYALEALQRHGAAAGTYLPRRACCVATPGAQAASTRAAAATRSVPPLRLRSGTHPPPCPTRPP